MCIYSWTSFSHEQWLSRRLLNPYGEIGSTYPSMSMIIIGLLLRILRQKMAMSAVWCLLTAWWMLYNGIEIHFQYQDRTHTMNNSNAEQKNRIEQKHWVEQKALNQTKNAESNKKHWIKQKALNRTKSTESNKSQTIITGTKQYKHWPENAVQMRLNCDCPILARVCDYGTNNSSPICPNVNYEKSNIQTRASLPSQRAHK
jgi:hypothetical protein